MKNKNKKSVKSRVNYILIFLVCCTPILTIFLFLIGNSTQNSMYTIWGIAIYPILSIIAVPNAIIHAIKDNKTDENDFILRKEFFDKYYIGVDNTDKYYKMIRLDLIKKTIISSVVIITIVFMLLYLSFNFYLNDGPERLNDRSISLKLLRPSYKVEGGIFLITMFLLAFGLPSIAYIIASKIHKIIVFNKRKYCCYKAIAENIDLSHNLHVKSLKKINGFKLVRKHDRNKFKNYKCIGISTKDIINKEVIIILIPGFAYLLKVDS